MKSYPQTCTSGLGLTLMYAYIHFSGTLSLLTIAQAAIRAITQDFDHKLNLNFQSYLKFLTCEIGRILRVHCSLLLGIISKEEIQNFKYKTVNIRENKNSVCCMSKR